MSTQPKSTDIEEIFKSFGTYTVKARNLFSAIIWSMLHLDYSSGFIPWDDLQGQSLEAYTCHDQNGKLIKITPKVFERHDSWQQIQADPAYHYNLGMIVNRPDTVVASTSQHPKAIQHRQEGTVLIYGKENYIMSLNSPSSSVYQNTTTTVIVKYTDDGNHTLTSNIKFGSGS